MIDHPYDCNHIGKGSFFDSSIRVPIIVFMPGMTEIKVLLSFALILYAIARTVFFAIHTTKPKE